MILAGGRGTRMGGADKGLLELAGRPLVAHLLEALRPQVATVLISANRNTEVYARFGATVVPDPWPDFRGPLAGIAAAGKLANRGNTLSATEAKTVRGDGIVTDGPFTEIKEFISGFVIVRTDTIEDAVSLAKANPVLKSGGTVEIREVIRVYVE